jgi:cell wall assembly regulator SMI1
MDFEFIRDRWRSLGVSVRDGASVATIADFEYRNRVVLPEDVRQYYSFMDGMENWDLAEEMISFWQLSEVGSVPEKLSHCRGIPDYSEIESVLPDAASYYVFADHSIWLNVYVMKLTPDRNNPSPIIWICGKSWHPLAESFAAFMDEYAADPWSIVCPKSLRKK